jgi:hypothetical protein
MRVAATTLAAALALLVPAAASGGAPSAHLPIRGVVPHAGAGFGALGPVGALNALAPAGPGNLVLNTQPCTLDNSCWVMRTNTVYAIYWIPSDPTACGGSPCRVSTNYESLINGYFTDVAAASGSASNVYSTDTQYYDATGPIAYQSTFAGSDVDHDDFPASGCDDGVDPVCLTDQQIEDEIQSVLTAKGWHGSTTTLFAVMTPDGVGSCFDASAAECTTNTYCAYHSGFLDSNDEPVLYANEPYDATISGCNPGSSPNGDAADAAINTLSHEHNETITDPAGNAWYAADGEEDGDLCAWNFGKPLGGTPGVDAYNQVINGDHYWLQQEYSNDGSACAQRYPFAVPGSTAPPTVSGAAAQGQLLSATHGAWSQVPTSYTYQWLRCTSANEKSCLAFPGASGSTYRLTAADAGTTIRVAVNAANSIGSSISAESASTSVVVPLPAATAAPAVTGVPAVGNEFSTTAGTWNTGVSLSYQWQRCDTDGSACTAIGGATSTTYDAVAADAGHTLRSVVTASNAAGKAGSSSAASLEVVAVPRSTGRPRISGKARVGHRLSAKHGGWTWSPTAYEFHWLRCSHKGSRCVAIKRATHAHYRLSKKDAGHRLRVRVTAVNVAGSGTATSRPSKAVRH